MGLNAPVFFETAQPTPHYYLFLVAILLSLWGLYVILHGRLGIYLRAIRDEEEAAQAIGINTVRWKLFAFTCSSLLAGAAGALYGHYLGLLSPIVVKLNEMVLIIIMVCTGGMRSFWGPLLGALFMQILSESLRINAVYF